jgi:hypothetical protein
MREDRMSCRLLQSKLSVEGSSYLTAEELEHLESCEVCAAVLLDEQLQRKPVPVVPGDFAARVTTAAMQQRQTAWHPRRTGLTAALVLSVTLLATGVVTTAVHPPHFTVAWFEFALQAATAIEAAGLTLWVAKEFYT